MDLINYDEDINKLIKEQKESIELSEVTEINNEEAARRPIIDSYFKEIENSVCKSRRNMKLGNGSFSKVTKQDLFEEEFTNNDSKLEEILENNSD